MGKGILNERSRFLIKNILRGFFYLALLIVAFLLLKNTLDEEQRQLWFGSIYDNPRMVISVYVISEILFGIIPPEVFMLWSLETGHMGPYLFSVGILSIISYGAGFANFSVGRLLKNNGRIMKIKNSFIRNQIYLFKKYGAFLMIVASVSPVPFSATALLCGAGGMAQRTYLLYSLLRILRFYVYGIVLQHVEGL
jgi:membrane protein YqaA with SNARE-associated domain